LNVFEQTGNKSEICRALSRIASVYKNLDKIAESDRYYQRALDLSIEAGDLTEQGLILNSYGVNFESSGRVEEAIRLYEQSLEICDRVGHLRGKSAALTNLGHVYERIGEFHKAKYHYQKSIDIKNMLGEPVAISISMTNLADVLYVLGEVEKGHQFNLKCMDLTLQAQALMYTARVVWSFSRFFAMKNQLDKALLLAFFLLGTQQSEQWVHDEAREYIAKYSESLGNDTLIGLKNQAKNQDLQGVDQWLRQPGILDP
jgi:tetratricopeptide (TPR) repeat protein